MMKNFSFLISAILLPTLLFAQFLKNYDGPPNTDVTFRAVVPWDSGFVTVGNLDNQILVVRFSYAGEVLSSRTITIIDKNETPVVRSAYTDTDFGFKGSILICGYRGTIGTASTYKAFIMRYDYSADSIRWIRTVGSTGTEGSAFNKVIFDNVVGYTSSVQNNKEAILWRFDRTTGDMAWLSNINHSSNVDEFTSVGHIGLRAQKIAVGNFDWNIEGDIQSCSGACRLTGWAGMVEFSNIYIKNNSQSAKLYSSDVVSGHGNSATFISYGDGSGTSAYKDLYVSKVTDHGELLYTDKIDFTETDFDGALHAIRKTPGGDYLYLGSKYNETSDDLLGNVFIIKEDVSGAVLWAKSYPFQLNDDLHATDAIMISGNSRLIAVGQTFNEATQHYSGCVLVVPFSTGELNGCGVDESVGIVHQTNVTQTMSVNNKTEDYLIDFPPAKIKSTSLVTSNGCINFVRSSADDASIKASFENTISVFPNPASAVATISFSLNQDLKVLIELFSLDGRKMMTIASENFSEGKYQIDFNSNLLSSGVYLLQLKTEEGVLQKKIAIE